MRRQSKRKLRYYWDTCCFIALLNREPTTDVAVLQALEQTYREMLQERVEIVSCSVLITELITPEGEKFISELRKCPAFEMAETVAAVHELARNLRRRCREANTHIPKTPDALHLASAILSKADEFWTTDQRLLSVSAVQRLLSVSAVVNEITICLPHVEQPKLGLE